MATVYNFLNPDSTEIEEQRIISAPGATPGDVLTVAANGTVSPAPGGGSGPYTFAKAELRFAEDGNDGTYTASVDLPPGARVIEVACFQLAQWLTSPADLKVGDGLNGDDDYINSIDISGYAVYDAANGAYPGGGGKGWIDPVIQAHGLTTDPPIYGSAVGLYYTGAGLTAAGVRYPDGGTIQAQIGPVAYTPTGPVATSSLGSSGGAGYAPGDTGTISAGNNDAVYVVDTVDGGGAVLTFHLSDPGTAYSVSSDYTTSVVTGGGDGNLLINVDTITPVLVPGTGVFVVDVIGWGVPPGRIDAVRS